jgi:hypothetical protein
VAGNSYLELRWRPTPNIRDRTPTDCAWMVDKPVTSVSLLNCGAYTTVSSEAKDADSTCIGLVWEGLNDPGDYTVTVTQIMAYKENPTIFAIGHPSHVMAAESNKRLGPDLIRLATAALDKAAPSWTISKTAVTAGKALAGRAAGSALSAVLHATSKAITSNASLALGML